MTQMTQMLANSGVQATSRYEITVNLSSLAMRFIRAFPFADPGDQICVICVICGFLLSHQG